MINRIPMFFMAFLLLFTLPSCGEDDNGGGGEVATLPTMSVTGVSKFEGDSSVDFEFSVRLSATTTEEVTVQYETADQSARAGEDYEETSGKLSIAAGSTVGTVTVAVYGDTISEGDEQFMLRLFGPENAIILTDEAAGTIRNDDTFVPGGTDGYTTPLSYSGYNLVWNDEFDASSIDQSDWGYDLGNHGWGNNEWQNYTNSSANSYISDGKLIIEAKKESSGGSDYSSARMLTQDKKEFQYGRVDIRAKLPKGQGIWPALWMLGGNFAEVSWPHCGEIDIMEIIGNEPNKLHGTIHWEGQNGYNSFGGNTTLDSGDFSDEYHVFSIIWDEQKIRWFLDDQVYHEVDITPAHMTEFHQPYFFIFNVAVGGNWPGYPDATTVFPQRMFVDYIRVFQEN